MDNILIYPHYIDQHIVRFNLWAPRATNAGLFLPKKNKSIPMKPLEKGYWEVTEDIEPGTRYMYEMDENKRFPDPASLSQPQGVHGASEVVDLADFEWTDADWKGIKLEKMIQYELHTGTFSPEGTFAGIISKLDYLVKLGINTIELLPVAQFSGNRNWGYDGVYPFAVQNSYGGPRELMKLVNACHQRKIAVIMDVVYNHFGPEGNYVGNFGYYFSEKYSTPWGSPINFDDAYSDGVRNYVIQNALMWLRDYHIDGLRLDAVHSIFDFSAKHILQELAENVKLLEQQTKKQYHLIAESHLNDVRYISPIKEGGYGLDAQWSDDFHHTIHAMFTRENKGYYMDFGSSSDLKKSLEKAFVFDGQYSQFRKKSYGNTTENNPGKQFVIFNQNHDQVGNRKFGERLITLTNPETARLAAAFMFLAPNIPMLFMGEEYGEQNPFLYFVSHESEKLNEQVRKGRENEFKDFYTDSEKAPDPTDESTFQQSKLSWNFDSDKNAARILAFYQAFIHLRKSHPVLNQPDKSCIEVNEKSKVFSIERWQGENKILAVLNTSQQTKQFKVPGHINGTLFSIFDSENERWHPQGVKSDDAIHAGYELTISPTSFVIYSNKTII